MIDQVDLLVVGGGINGAGIARDAVGRGLRVILCEKDDLAQGTSSRSGKLVHGGLRYLEQYEFRLVREALIEREILLDAAPHIIWPMRFVLPHTSEQRPAWLIRLGLLLYDHLGARKRLPATRRLDLRTAQEGDPLKPGYTTAFEYSDCWVDDARLVVLNARDAADRGAEVLTRTSLERATREERTWRAVLHHHATGARRVVRTRAIANAAGPWVEETLSRALGINSPRHVRLVKGSHIVTRKFWEGDHAYLLQNHDKRVIFVNPYEGDLALIGTTDIPVDGDPAEAKPDPDEIRYLLDVVNRYFETQLSVDDVAHSFAGVRPLYDDQAQNPSAVTRDYVFDLEPRVPDPDHPTLLSVFGGKITTYRRLAEHALERLRPAFPHMDARWTEHAKLPGGDIPNANTRVYARSLGTDKPWLPKPLIEHYVSHYGCDTPRLLGNAKTVGDLGRRFGPLLFEREIDYLVEHEWAQTAEDVLERRTKHGLKMTDGEKAAVAALFAHENAIAAHA